MSNYIELNIQIKSDIEEASQIIIAELSEIDFECFEEIETGILAFIPVSKFDIQKVMDIQYIALNKSSLEITYQEIEQKNWNEEWEKEFSPVIVDDKCIIKAPFHKDLPNYQYEIIIEPKMSFGTGHHETTSSVVSFMLETNFSGKKVLDYGSGTGILAILASKMGAESVVAIDYDDWSIENSNENIIVNNTKNIQIILSDSPNIIQQTYDIVIANINRNILLNQVQNIKSVVKKNSLLILSGFYNEDITSILECYSKLGFEFINKKEKNNWVAIMLQLK